MTDALKQGEMRTYVEDFEELRIALRETYIADNNTLVHVRVMFDNIVVTHAMGSVDLVLAAITEAFRFIAPLLVQSSYVQVQIGTAGRR